MSVAQLREGIRAGSGLWFYDCPVCPCDFGTMGPKAKAEREAAEHDAKYHPVTCPACGSESPGELGYAPGFSGMPATCRDDWHDADARVPGDHGEAATTAGEAAGS